MRRLVNTLRARECRQKGGATARANAPHVGKLWFSDGQSVAV